MAHRRLGISLSNRYLHRERARAALTRAWELRDRLTDRERFITESSYYMSVLDDNERSAAMLRSGLERYPTDSWLLTNLGAAHSRSAEFEQAATLFDRAWQVEPSNILPLYNLVISMSAAGRADSARAVAATLREQFPDHPLSFAGPIIHHALSREYDGIEPLADSALARFGGSASRAAAALAQRYEAATARGRLADAAATARRLVEARERLGVRGARDFGRLREAQTLAFVLGQNTEAARVMDDLYARDALADLEPDFYPHYQAVVLELRLGRVDRARRLVADYERTLGDSPNLLDRSMLAIMRNLVKGFGEGQPMEAASFRVPVAARECLSCQNRHRAELFEAAGLRDSALAAWTEYVERPGGLAWFTDSHALHQAYLRLGELHEWKGNREAAIDFYGRFTELWKDADPELQPRVAAVRHRIAQLSAER